MGDKRPTVPTPPLPIDRFRIRRRMAVTAFATVVLMVPSTFTMILMGGENMGDKLLHGSSILGPVTACLTAIVWKYFGDVTRNDLKEIRDVQDDSQR